MKGGYSMKKKMRLLLMLAGFLLAAQPARAFDAGSWFTGRVSGLDKALYQTRMTSRSSGRQRHSSTLQRVMKQFKQQNHSKTQHSRR
jgi:hypothetical protein